jgi:hypothetical protein
MTDTQILSNDLFDLSDGIAEPMADRNSALVGASVDTSKRDENLYADS